MIEWQKFVNALGYAEISEEFLKLENSIGEKPEISEDPIEYNDPDQTKYYEFFQTGILIGFRKQHLNHIQFFFKAENNYSIYKGKLFREIDANYTEKMIIELLGNPSNKGGNEQSPFLGYINSWVLYDMGSYTLHFEFTKNGDLSLATVAVLSI
jgi:hypothetical protein